MASVNFEKFKSAQEVKAMLRHCDKYERMNTVEHSNEHIQKSLIANNVQFGGNYKETCERYDKRIAYLDTLPNQNKRKDRVTCFGLEIPFPEGIKDTDEIRWVDYVIDTLYREYGSDNVLNVYVHRDEQHEYTDATTGAQRVSRIHMHAYVIPEIDGKLNGKEFSSRKRIKVLNNTLHEMTRKYFSLDFMNGTQAKSKSSVEELKIKSKLRELEIRETALNARENALNALESNLRAQRENYTLLHKKTLKMQNTALERHAKADERERELLKREEECSRLHTILQNRIDETPEPLIDYCKRTKFKQPIRKWVSSTPLKKGHWAYKKDENGKIITEELTVFEFYQREQDGKKRREKTLFGDLDVQADYSDGIERQ